ncbi:MAG TPA: hypothetical protein ENF18_04725 [candidate division WOR-3 bacterium]|uniref:Uncharacterized protein n=1 Tax=candidate division WOR-3 bacterium TaxID=2052148 RepID=A0A7C0VDK1_UNCW3|nr:hypothetical protein [candidate division WOR-3 bacterium]
MKKHLLIITASDDTPIVDEWLQERNEPLDIIYILNEEIPEEVSSWMLYTGFLGEKPTEDVVNAIKEEMRIRGEERLVMLKERFSVIKEVQVTSESVENVIEENKGKYPEIFIAKRKNIEEVR